MEEPRRFKPEPPPLAAMKPHAARLPQRTRGASAPENGAYWREAPNLPRYGKRSARRVKFSGGTSRFPRGPSRPNTLCYGTSQTCRGCRGEWKFGSLDAWKFGFLVVQLFLSGVLFSVFCSPFSRARRRPSPAGAWGSAPYPNNQPINQPIPFVSFVVPCVLCGKNLLAVQRAVARPKSAKICGIGVFIILAVLDAAVGHIGPIGRLGRRLSPLCTTASPVARLPRVPFSVLRSLFSGRQSRPRFSRGAGFGRIRPVFARRGVP